MIASCNSGTGSSSGIVGKSYFGVNTNQQATYEIEFINDSKFKWSKISNSNAASFDEGTYTFDGTNITCTYNSGGVRTMQYNKSENSIADGDTAWEYDDPSKRNQ